MSERFERIYADVDVFCRDHNAKGISQLIEKEDYDKIVDLLNGLNDENRQLKFELNECREHKLFSRRELERENKELKRLLQEVEHELISLNGLYVFDKCASQLGYVEVFDDDYWDLDYSEMIDEIEKVLKKGDD